MSTITMAITITTDVLHGVEQSLGVDAARSALLIAVTEKRDEVTKLKLDLEKLRLAVANLEDNSPSTLPLTSITIRTHTTIKHNSNVFHLPKLVPSGITL